MIKTIDAILTVLGAAIAWSPLYALPAALGVVPALLLIRRRTGQVYAADWATLCVPFLVWIAITQVPGVHKSLSNLVEVPTIGLGVAVLAVARWFAAGRGRDRAVSWAFLACACATAIVVGLLVPSLPE
jgi:hypothetical protein